MERARFNVVMDEVLNEIEGIMARKGADYSGEEDALANLKNAGRLLELRPEQVWFVYAVKHWDAITTYCREGKVDSEGIRGRVLDLMNYGILLIGLVEEKQDAQNAIESLFDGGLTDPR